MAKEKYIVTINRPDQISKRGMMTYIREAVACWRGGLDPMNDPLFYIDNKYITVKTLKPKKRK